MDDLAKQPKEINVKATQHQTHDPAATEQKKRQRHAEIEETWSKRQHALVQTTFTPINLTEKYSP